RQPPSPRPVDRRQRPARPGRRRPAPHLAPGRPIAPRVGSPRRTDPPWPPPRARAARSAPPPGCGSHPSAGTDGRGPVSRSVRGRWRAASSPPPRSRRSRSRPYRGRCRARSSGRSLPARADATERVFPQPSPSESCPGTVHGMEISRPAARWWLPPVLRLAAAFSAVAVAGLVVWQVLTHVDLPSADSLLHDYGYLGVAIGAFGDSFGLPSSGEICAYGLGRAAGPGVLRRFGVHESSSVHVFMARYGARAVAAARLVAGIRTKLAIISGST